MNFIDLGVRAEIVRALEGMKITEPTEIQEKVIPALKSGKDLVGVSKTGSGKTAAFGIPLLEQIHAGQGVQGLILVPTRELAVQVSDELRKFGRYMKCFITAVYGGVGMGPQIENMGRADIVVGTPGRIKDHLQHRTLDLSHVKCAILDEADKMVDMGFIEDVDDILSYMPKEKQMLLFGATLSDEINILKKKHMREPFVVKTSTQVQEELLQQFYYNVQPHEKFSLLVHLLKKEQYQRAIVFCSTRNTVEIVTKNLRKQSVHAEMMHGKLSQNRRLQVIRGFHEGRYPVLVASAVAARGLDIKDVTHIFNYDLSQDPQEYIHRVGRTARAGESGKAITLLGPRDYDAFQAILHQYRVPVEELIAEQHPRVPFEFRSEGRFGRFGQRSGGRQGFGRREEWGRGQQGSRGERGEQRERWQQQRPQQRGAVQVNPNRMPAWRR